MKQTSDANLYESGSIALLHDALDDLEARACETIQAANRVGKAVLSVWIKPLTLGATSGQMTTRAAALHLMTIKEIAAYLNANERSIHNWMKTGELPYRRVGSDIRFDMAEVDEWTKRHRKNAHGIPASNGKVRSLPT